MAERAESPETQKMMDWYKDAYRVGEAIAQVGNVIKTIGFVAGAIIIVVSSSMLIRLLDRPGLLIGIVFGCFVWLLLYVIGIIVAAQGQVLKATLDSAVNSLPFLTNEHRSEIMSLRVERSLWDKIRR